MIPIIFIIFVLFSPPLSTIAIKGCRILIGQTFPLCQVLMWQVNHERVSVWDQFYHFGSNQHICISELLGLIQEQAFSHILQWLSCSCWLNTYGHVYDLNTRFASPQTCHMPPLDQYIKENNSGAIHTSNSFDFSWMSLFKCILWLDALSSP